MDDRGPHEASSVPKAAVKAALHGREKKRPREEQPLFPFVRPGEPCTHARKDFSGEKMTAKACLGGFPRHRKTPKQSGPHSARLSVQPTRRRR
ncbi:hypothetical protein MRX96_056371 [Rhipicephalus microplus]